MKMRKLLLALIVCICFGAAQAAIIGQENFNYAEGSLLTGLDGGTNWDTGYTWESAVSSNQTFISNSALQIGTGTELDNNANLISRRFGYYSGDVIYAKVTITATENYNPSDFFVLWLDTSNTSTSHDTINAGFGLSSDGVMARISSSLGTITNGAVVQGTEYTLLVRLSKSVSGSANNYDSMSFWVNPVEGDAGTPLETLNTDTGKRGFSWLGVRTVLNESDNVYVMDDITVATSWNDLDLPAVTVNPAEVLGSDDFDYADGTELTGLSGGTGWEDGYSWTSAVDSAETFMTNSTLQFGTGAALTDDPNLISRRFGYYTDPDLYFKATLTATQGYDSGDFFVLWLDTGNTSTSHSGVNMGFDISGNVIARINSTAGNSMTYGSVVEGVEYTLLIKLSKSVAGSANNYDSMSFWVNPTSADLGSPLQTLNVDTGKRGFSWIGVRSVNTEDNNVFVMDDVAVTLTWDALALPAGTADPDADEDGMDDAWEITNFGGASVANGGPDDDWDVDGMVNLHEFLAGTVPTNAASLLTLEGLVSGATDTIIQWQAVSGKNYSLLYTASLADGWTTNTTGIAGVEPSCVHTAAVTGTENFFKVILDQ